MSQPESLASTGHARQLLHSTTAQMLRLAPVPEFDIKGVATSLKLPIIDAEPVWAGLLTMANLQSLPQMHRTVLGITESVFVNYVPLRACEDEDNPGTYLPELPHVSFGVVLPEASRAREITYAIQHTGWEWKGDWHLDLKGTPDEWAVPKSGPMTLNQAGALLALTGVMQQLPNHYFES